MADLIAEAIGLTILVVIPLSLIVGCFLGWIQYDRKGQANPDFSIPPPMPYSW